MSESNEHSFSESVREVRASRRRILKSGAAMAAFGVLAQAAPNAALAQNANAPDAEITRLQAARRVLIKGGLVLTLDRQLGDFAHADILIEDGKIRTVRPDIAISGESAAIVDAANRIVIPGFVDTHSHSYQGILRSIMPDGVLDPDYNRDVQTTLTPAFAPPDVYAGVLMTALGMIDMGTTAMVDLCQISHTPEHSDACIAALVDSGIRAVHAYSRGLGPATQYPQDIARLQRTYFSSRDQLLTLALGVGLDPKLFAAARDAAVPAVLHLRYQSAAFVELARAGLLREGDEYIHCNGLIPEAWQLIRDSGGHVSICAAIDMAMGHGMPAVQAALDHGVRPSLSSDHGVAIAQDFFSVMRSTFTVQRLGIFERRRSGERALPPLLTCREVLEFATIEGARCANLADKVGTLTPGKEADVVLLRTDQASLWPIGNAVGAVVNLMNPGNVETVFIGGKPRKWRGRLVGVDLDRTFRLAEDARQSVMRRAGFSVNLLG
ncbi:MAG: amidohydrolase family protein [Xanthobacteraceae bacterium]|nr:amidohydrolase family protein [Xanthobacteraceae bacterium]